MRDESVLENIVMQSDQLVKVHLPKIEFIGMNIEYHREKAFDEHIITYKNLYSDPNIHAVGVTHQKCWSEDPTLLAFRFSRNTPWIVCSEQSLMVMTLKYSELYDCTVDHIDFNELQQLEESSKLAHSNVYFRSCIDGLL